MAGLITDGQLRSLAEPLAPSGYGEYLLRLLAMEGADSARRQHPSLAAPPSG